MFKYLFLILFILFSFNVVLGDTIELPYTDSSNYTDINMYYNDEYNFSCANENEIFDILIKYRCGVLITIEGVYISNITFTNNYINTTISEKYNITDAFASKKVEYTITLYENDIITGNIKEVYYIFPYAVTFAQTNYFFDKNQIIIKNKYSDLSGYTNNEYTLNLDKPLSLNVFTINNNMPLLGKTHVYIEYIKIGVKPKSYYIDKLHPILRLPYNSIKKWDNENNLLNILLISSYILNSLFFWIKVLYTSMFTILIIILIALIPFISLQQSNNRNDFINKLFRNYTNFFQIILNIVKYMINLIIKLIELIPFI